MVRSARTVSVDDLLIHDEKAEEPTLAYLLSRMIGARHVPGAGRRVPRRPQADLRGTAAEAGRRGTARKGKGDLEKLFRNDDLWVVRVARHAKG